MIDLKQNSLLREIPDNLLRDEKVVNLANSLQNSLDRMLNWGDKINYTTNIDSLPDEIIEHLLWEKHIEYTEGLALATTREHKINLIRNAIELHRTKGTPYAIEFVLQTVGLKGEVVEWFEYNGEPYTFKILLSASGRVDLVSGDLKNLINSFKNVRSHFEYFEIKILDIVAVVTAKEYTFDVPYPVTGTFYTAPINGVASKVAAAVETKTYANSVPYPVTGTFYCLPEGGY